VAGELVEVKKDGVYQVGDLVIHTGEGPFVVSHVWEGIHSASVKERDPSLPMYRKTVRTSELKHWVEPDLRRKQGKARTLPELLAVAKERGYSPGWAHRVHNARQQRA
jgi:hypothetical protein